MRPNCLRMPELRTSSLGPDSVGLGAIRLGLNKVETQLFAMLSRPMT